MKKFDVICFVDLDYNFVFFGVKNDYLYSFQKLYFLIIKVIIVLMYFGNEYFIIQGICY